MRLDYQKLPKSLPPLTLQHYWLDLPLPKGIDVTESGNNLPT